MSASSIVGWHGLASTGTGRRATAGAHDKVQLVLGDPKIALTWLANELNAYGLMLRVGETITTGTCVVPFALRAGDRFSADFGILGSVTISIEE